MDIDGIRPPAGRSARRSGANARPTVRSTAGTGHQAPRRPAATGRIQDIARPARHAASARTPQLVAQPRKPLVVPSYQPAKVAGSKATAAHPKTNRASPISAQADKKAKPVAKRASGRPPKATRRRRVRRTILLGAAGLLLILLGTGGFLSWRAYANLHKVFHGTQTVAALASKPVTPDLLKGEGDGRVNILLLGIGGPGHDGPDLTDTIVVMSVDPVNNTATMVSVPRDLWIQQPVNYFGKQQKINAAYESGKYHYLGHLDSSNANAAAVEAGFASIDQAIKDVLGVTINYHALVNFQAFRQAVDTVGGVTVDVPTQLYDPTMAWENHWNPVLAPVGVQQMDGVKALLYARSRETTSDFARSQRQRQILLALKDKVLSAGTLSNPAKIDGLLNAFGNNVYSDLSTQGAMRLVDIMKKVSDTQVGSVGLSEDPHKLIVTDRVGNISVDRPVAGYDNYTAIQDYVRSQLLDGYLVKEHAAVTVLAPTVAGATADGETLKTYGYNITTTVANTATAPTAPILVDLSHGKAPFTLHYLQTHFSVTAVSSLPAGITVPAGSAKFVIIEPK
jgi:LCP family protein required for cell wall assembly